MTCEHPALSPVIGITRHGRNGSCEEATHPRAHPNENAGVNSIGGTPGTKPPPLPAPTWAEARHSSRPEVLCMAHGVYETGAITAQNTLGTQAVELLSPNLVVARITPVLDNIGADAVKTGMPGAAPIIERVADVLRRSEVRQPVVDPVMVVNGGQARRPAARCRHGERPARGAVAAGPGHHAALPDASVLLGGRCRTRRICASRHGTRLPLLALRAAEGRTPLR